MAREECPGREWLQKHCNLRNNRETWAIGVVDWNREDSGVTWSPSGLRRTATSDFSCI